MYTWITYPYYFFLLYYTYETSSVIYKITSGIYSILPHMYSSLPPTYSNIDSKHIIYIELNHYDNTDFIIIN